MKLKAALLVQVLSLSAAFAGVNEAWHGYSKPSIMATDLISKMSTLPLEGSIEVGPRAWSGSYWPNYKGSINVRWNAPGKPGFDLVSPTLAQARLMTQDQLAELSPTEKFDLLNARYNYPLKNKVAQKANPKADTWNGICHGWSPAAINHNEPTPKTLTNPDGLVIPFGSSDIKALLSYYYATHKTGETAFMGKRCTKGRLMSGHESCDQDMNAGAFHIVISNMLGLRKEGFVADIERYKEVWNQPVVGYKSNIAKDDMAPSRKAAKGTVKEMQIETRLFYVHESPKDTWEVAHGTRNQEVIYRDLVYRIEINALGEIVGGTWVTGERPDFLWNKPRTEVFQDGFERLAELLND